MKFKGDLIAIALLPICIGLIFIASEKRKADWHHNHAMQSARIWEARRARWDINEPTSGDHLTSREYMNYYASNGMVDRVSQVLKMENGYDFPALSLAAKNNQLEVVELMLESGLPDLNHIRTASSDAAIAGHLETFKLLFKQDGAFDPEFKDYDIINKVVEGGSLEAFKLCLEHYDLQWHEYHSQPLKFASFLGSIEIVKYMIKQGADVNSQDTGSLKIAAREGHTEIIKVLVSSGANIHADDDKAFRNAAWSGETEAVKLLLSYGADVHAKNEVALQNAVMNENKELVEVLLEAGADFNAFKNPSGFANSVKDKELRKLLKAQISKTKKINKAVVTLSENDLALKRAVKQGSYRKVKSALESGANVNVDDGWPIRLAAIDGNASIVKLLLDHGANPRANEDQALIGAARRGRTAVVKLLLDSGPETYVYSKQVLGPAAGLGHTETVRVLLDYGADLHVDNDWPLRWATIEGHKSTVELLLERGANADAVDKGELEKLLKSPLERQLNKLQGERNQLNFSKDCNIPEDYYFPEQDKAFFCDLDEQNFIFEDSNIK